jgi:hypothetical protein
MPCGHLNAMRFDQKPLAQPAYSFVHVPKAKADLAHSSLQRITNREHFQICMAEMLLLGKEAVRRRNHHHEDDVATNSGAKPLSLEYLADRLDVDDPCFGYLVRTKAPPAAQQERQQQQDERMRDCTACVSDTQGDVAPTTAAPLTLWKEGMLQGFITVTTFTNWQKSFRWDSLNPEAYGFDPPALIKQRLRGIRQWDSDGTLAKELQQTVHCGDIWAEGIVWPRIAEISLLGGLGCGRVSSMLLSGR